MGYSFPSQTSLYFFHVTKRSQAKDMPVSSMLAKSGVLRSASHPSKQARDVAPWQNIYVRRERSEIKRKRQDLEVGIPNVRVYSSPIPGHYL